MRRIARERYSEKSELGSLVFRSTTRTIIGARDWLAPCPCPPCTSNAKPSNEQVTSALSNRISVGRLLIACVLLAPFACKGDAAGDAPRRTASSGKPAVTSAEAPGDVIIAPPTAAYKTVAVNAPGTVSGTVTLKSALLPLAPTPTGAAGPQCGASIADQSIVVQGGGLVGAVVWLDGVRSGKALGAERRLELESDHCRLVPRVQTAAVGSAVNIVGHDDLRQHLRFTAGGETTPRATILLGGGEQVIPTELPFRAPGLVVVHDAEHAWTRAYLAVFDHPYHAVTIAGGAFTIDGVPAGKYTLRTWHERTGATAQAVEVTANGLVKVAVVLEGK